MLSISRGTFALRPYSVSRISARLYAAMGLLLFAVVALGAGALYFVHDTAGVLKSITQKVVVTGKTANDAAVLLERHRRIVQSSPLDTSNLTALRQRRTAASLIGELRASLDVSPDFDRTMIMPYLERLSRRADIVMLAAGNGNQRTALAAMPDYDGIAQEVQKIISSVRDRTITESRTEVARQLAEGRALTTWAVIALLITLLFSGPLSVAIVRNISRRIDSITSAMRRLAVNDTTVRVPAVDDMDEVGDMARALRVFRRNAIMLFEHSREIEKLNGWFDIALNNMTRGLSMFDADGRLVVCNRMYRELYSLPEELVRPGVSMKRFIEHFVSHAGCDPDQMKTACDTWLATHRAAIASGEPFTKTHELSNGRAVVVHIQPLHDGGWVDLHEDVTEKRVVEARIAHLASSDPLTGLANRRNFLERLAWALAGPAGQTSTVLWLDLDRFKEVNDSHGHPTGDELLKAVAERLRASLRNCDVIARLGGDEFAVLVHGPAMPRSSAVALADRVIGSIGRPYSIFGQQIVIGASAGIAIAPEHGNTPDALLMKADIALYRAKTNGCGASVLYEESFEQEMKLRRQREAELRNALAVGGLTLHYQPIIDLSLGRVTSCEALMRWNHPEHGMIPPSDFIPLAEEIGLIGAMGDWAVAQACRDAKEWPDDVKVAVNLSADQFAGSDLVSTVVAAVAAADIPASRLELEVTETVLLRDNARTLETLEMLRDIGVGIALDDFGTGYASLSYLRSFPFTKIKIDQSFVRDLPCRENCVSIVRAVAALARALDMRTVAEGVETTDHLELVAAAGCSEVQGYHFSRPVPATEVPAAIARCTKLAAVA